jgi:hypothetical protein
MNQIAANADAPFGDGAASPEQRVQLEPLTHGIRRAPVDLSAIGRGESDHSPSAWATNGGNVAADLWMSAL